MLSVYQVCHGQGELVFFMTTLKKMWVKTNYLLVLGNAGSIPKKNVTYIFFPRVVKLSRVV